MLYRRGFLDKFLCSTRQEIWTKVLPVYWNLGREEDRTIRVHLRGNNSYMLPTTCHGHFRDGMWLCTLCYLYWAFPFSDRKQEWKILRQYVGKRESTSGANICCSPTELPVEASFDDLMDRYICNG